MRGCGHPQAAIAGLEPLIARAAGKAARLDVRRLESYAQADALRGMSCELRPEDAEMLRNTVEKFALPKLKKRVVTTFVL